MRETDEARRSLLERNALAFAVSNCFRHICARLADPGSLRTTALRSKFERKTFRKSAMRVPELFLRRWSGTIGILLVVLLSQMVIAAGSQALAQQLPILKVGVYVSPPFVTKNGDAYSGMAIELWQNVGARLNFESEYQEFRNYNDLIAAVAAGTVEAGVSDLGITADRAKLVDFTHPWFDAGLRVMVHSQPIAGFSDLIRRLADAGHVWNYALMALLVILATATMTIFDRRFDEEAPKRWRDGLAENFYQVMSLATQGEASRKNLLGWIGRIWQGICMVLALAVVAYVTSSVTSVMTATQLANQINSVADLQGKIVAVRTGSVAEDYMRSTSANRRPFDHMADAADALLKGEVSAIVGDGPVLEYYAHSHPDLPLDVVGHTFRPEKYGFAFGVGSSYTKPASVAIISLQESGEIEKLKAKYFGFNP